MRTIDGPCMPDQSTVLKRPSGLQSLTSSPTGLKNRLVLAALLIAAPVQAQEAQITPVQGEEARAPSSDMPIYTLRTPVETIAADPAAVAVLNRDLPGLLTDPSYPIFKTMSLKQMQEASGGDLSLVDVNKALADLQTLPPR
jgi:hypothetical protein